ncbi:hypothetical protein VYI52_26230 (plasmid) [Escherichia coli]|uniref:hypothetical protein n=1 Tax=Escherichia coli TaxID=562 RepID=UPI002E2F0470|nr:hypothetical protein [Escherichia coli]
MLGFCYNWEIWEETQNPKAGDNSDYVPASSDNSITGTQRTAEDNFTGAWISMRPRNVAFNYIVRAA